MRCRLSRSTACSRSSSARCRSPASSSPARAGATDMDLSFFSWDVISKYVVSGFWFSIQLTIVATLGGILFGTVLALMRLSGSKVLTLPATFYVNGMRSVPLVMVILWFFLLMPGSFYDYLPNGANHRAEYSA